MLQHAAKPGCTVIVGKSGSGKTTFALRLLVARKDLACRFIFEGPKLDMSERLKLSCAETEDELLCAVEDGFVLFDSSRMFPGDRKAGLEWFCRWSYQIAGNMPGAPRNALIVDEVWKYCSPYAIPQPLSEWIQDGRKLGMETIFATQTPNKLHESILNEATELVCFRLQGENALQSVASLGANADEVGSLPLGAFVSLNVDSGAELRGRFW
jgi:energy-coupling factor transporter ATP-binding protein EcfA2